MTNRVDSEVGRLGTVVLHRPGAELARLTPRNNDSLLFDGIPWVQRAQEEHDTFAGALRSRGVEVLYLADLVAEVLAIPAARAELTAAVLADVRLGDTLRAAVAAYLADLDPARLADRADGRRRARGAEDRHRPGLRADGPARLRHRPAAEPAVHPRLRGLDRRPGRRHQPGHAGPAPGDHADRGDLPPPPAVRRDGTGLRPGAGVPRGRRRPGARARRARGRASASAPGRPAPSGWPAAASSSGSRTPCWWCRSRRSGRRCTWTPCARWSTSTPWSCTRTSPTRWRPGPSPRHPTRAASRASAGRSRS